MTKTIKVMAVSFITNIFLAILKIVMGFLGKSSALIMDGVHSFSDLATDVIAIIGITMSQKAADKKHPFGHGKTEYITSFIVGSLIIFLGFGLISEMLDKPVTKPNILIGFVILFTIVLKYIIAAYLLKKGKKHRNTILIASAKESKGDVFSSIIVLISIIGSQFSDTFPMLIYTDKVASIIVAVYIIRVGFEVIKENYSFLLGEKITDEQYLIEINEIMTKSKFVKGINDLNIIKYGPNLRLTGVLKMDDALTLLKAHTIVDKIEINLKKHDKKIIYITLHMEPMEK